VPYFVAIKEASFFFPDPICNWLRALSDDDVEEFLATLSGSNSPEFLEAGKAA
jgi:hypothetical protein